MDEKILSLIIGYCKNSLNEKEFNILKDWIEEDSLNKDSFNDYVRIFRRYKQMEFVGSVSDKAAWKNISVGLKKPEITINRVKRFTWIKYAASVVVLIAVGIAVYLTVNDNNIPVDRKMALMELKTGNSQAVLTLSDGSNMSLPNNEEKDLAELNGSKISIDKNNTVNYESVAKKSDKLLFNTIKVPRAGEYSLRLSDGTMVWLNSDTELKYPVQFGDKERRVYLKGEAFFSVSKDKKKAFVVETYGTKVKVLGTRFNVSSYKGKDEIVTTLVEGSVMVKDCNNCAAKIKPGQQAKSGLNHVDVDVKDVDTDLYTLWMDGIFKYENKAFSEITEQLERWYDVEFVFDREEIKDVRFAGAINKDKPLYFALFMIEQLSDVKFEVVSKKKIKIYKK